MRTFILLALSMPAWATPTQLADTTPGGADTDGFFDAGEYATVSTGINAGFGGTLGAAELGFDSDENGNLQIGLSGGQPNDFVTLYIDSVAGGITDTTAINDGGDPHRAATTGVNTMGGAPANLYFAPGFEADFAITCGQGLCVTYDIRAQPIVFVGLTDYSAGTDVELELAASDIGLTAPGASFDFVATYGNPLDGAGYFRSNEFHGVSDATVPGDNPGFDEVTLAAGDFSTFQTWCADDDANGVCDSTLSTTAMIPGQTATLTVDNAPAGAQVLFFVSTAGTGVGPCAPAAFGGACLDILNPTQLGRGRANASGTASLSFRVPNGAPNGLAVDVQAVWAQPGMSDTTAVVPVTVGAP